MAAYTDADVRAGWSAAYGGPLSERDVFPVEFRDIEDAIAAVAPAIAARALRDAAKPMLANCDQHGYGENAAIEAGCEWCSAFGVDQDWVERLTNRADEIERL